MLRANIYMGLSALVKAIRLRHRIDAVAFLFLLHERFPFAWYRSARRILIGSAEDGLSIPVQLHVSKWFETGYRKDAPLIEAIREVARICAVPNWWEPTGHKFIFEWERGTRMRAHPSFRFRKACFRKQLRGLETAILDGCFPKAIAVLECFDKERGFDPSLLGQMLKSLAVETKNSPAEEVAGIYLRHNKALSGDTNFTGQAIYRLIHGELGVQVDPEISDATCEDLLQAGKERLSRLTEIPPYMLDGIHSSGRDKRFAGLIEQMAACCRAFDHYGRLDPRDEWLDTFYTPNMQQAAHEAPMRSYGR